MEVAEVFAFLVVLGVLGGDAYLVDVGIVVTHTDQVEKAVILKFSLKI